ncbi:cupin domain-containing protein [Niabella terrae]
METIVDKKVAGHYFWGENCRSWVLLDQEGLSVKQELMPAATREQLHFHKKAQQLFYILKGEASFYLEDRRLLVKSQQSILVHPGAQHYIANETLEELEFLVISQPSTKGDRTAVSTVYP